MILVIGGAGFIGSIVNQRLVQMGYETVVLDNLSRGDRRSIHQGTFIQGEMGDIELLDKIFKLYRIDTVMHFAAWIDVGESVLDPAAYYTNNVVNTLHLLQSMRKHGIPYLIFSSSAAIFGMPQFIPINENHPKNPLNPYGRTKLMVEQILEDCDRAYGLKYAALRYFNAAGGDPEGKIKNYKTKESNLIPIALRSLLVPHGSITIFGTDYPTPDGTCVRDYIHVQDIADAHILTLEKLQGHSASCSYNLGNGSGFSVREVIAAVEKVTGKQLNIKQGSRRLGDGPLLVADASKAQQELGWKRHFPSLEKMIEHAWLALNP